ncbi:MAG: hypothetical protein ACTSYU_06315 [Promethearchaeota archaeon]
MVLVKITRLGIIKFTYLFGMILDLVAAVEMFASALWGNNSPFIGFGLTIEGNSEYRYAMFIGAVFMLGWTIILGWGYGNPIERRGILLITAVPVVLGLMVSEFLQIMWGMSSFLNFLPVLILQTGIMVLMIISWYFAGDLAKKPVQYKKDSKI